MELERIILEGGDILDTALVVLFFYLKSRGKLFKEVEHECKTCKQKQCAGDEPSETGSYTETGPCVISDKDGADKDESNKDEPQGR